MQQDADKRLHGNEGACIDGKWYVFKDEFDKLKQLFLQGKWLIEDYEVIYE